MNEERPEQPDGEIYQCEHCKKVSFEFLITSQGHSKQCFCPPWSEDDYYEVIK